MNKRILISLLTICLAVASIAGGTLAWFTAEAEIDPNTFTAGILEIDAKEDWAFGEEGLTNWNPGDCTDKEITIKVTGTKRAFVRAMITETWTGTDGNESINGTWHGRNAPNVNWWVCDEDGESCDAWPAGDWTKIGKGEKEYWYYKGILDPGENGPNEVTVLSRVCLAGKETGNAYQGAIYTLGMKFEAIQVTHEAAFEEWGVGFVDNEWVEVEFNTSGDRWETQDGNWYWDGTAWVAVS